MTADSNPAAPADDGLFAIADPIALFGEWYEAACARETGDDGPAMALATADADGLPNVRMVLLKDYDARGFVFYTNLESIKGQELAARPHAALCFHWKTLKRQVRIRGPVTQVSDAEADAYFATRAKDSQIGAWASDQSRPLESRFALEKRVAKVAAKYALGKLDRPPFWSGYRVAPLSIEFWRHGLFRLHDRQIFRRESVDSTAWSSDRLYP